jgi:two-component system, LytTR family, sensor kinase
MPAAPPNEPRRSRGRAALAYAAAWTLVAGVYVGLYATTGAAVGEAVRNAIATTAPNALLGLVSLRLARRWPWPVDREARRRLAVRLIPALFGLAIASTLGWLALVQLDRALFPPVNPRPLPLAIFLWELLINDLIHTALAAIGYAKHNALALAEERARASRAEVLRARAELQLLRSQLHPHFVLNVLHAMLGLVRRDPARAETGLERLGELLRFGQWVHATGSDWVPLSREWEFVRSYLDLERVRLGDRLRVTLEADEAALGVPVPPFALQPLVENAIVHAVAPRAAGGAIEISARRTNGTLHIAVRDDGPGAAESAIGASPRMGLRLLRERLAALYAGRAVVAFERPEGGGFRVRLDLPDDGAVENA